MSAKAFPATLANVASPSTFRFSQIISVCPNTAYNLEYSAVFQTGPVDSNNYCYATQVIGTDQSKPKRYLVSLSTLTLTSKHFLLIFFKNEYGVWATITAPFTSGPADVDTAKTSIEIDIFIYCSTRGKGALHEVSIDNVNIYSI